MKKTSSLSKRENAPDYIPLSDSEASEMLKTIGASSPDSLYSDFDGSFSLPSTRLGRGMSADDTLSFLSEVGAKNKAFSHSFLGDGLPVWNVEPIAAKISQIRGLTTAYTPYQPERSQGTLISHWIYQCAMSALLGFEAVNCSLYDRSTAIFEACACACRLLRKNTVVLSDTLFECDIEVVKTLAAHTKMKVVVEYDIAVALDENSDAACVVFPQISNVGTLVDVDALSDLCVARKVKSVAVIDPMLLGAGGLKPPSQFGANGADIAVGEGQHLCSLPNFGGAGLGVFAVRFNEKNKTDVRQAAGRFVGRAKDIEGRMAFAMVLSAREQHIRHEKATSNICSNEAFLATLAGACLLEKGDAGMKKSLEKARCLAVSAFERISKLDGFVYPFGDVPFFNEFCLRCEEDVATLMADASKQNILIGADVSGRSGEKKLLKLSFTDANSEADIDALVSFLAKHSRGEKASSACAPKIPLQLLRNIPPDLPKFEFDTLCEYYEKLGELNVSPDDSCYPLGSCTMKYNPLLCDKLALIESFQNVHPQTRQDDAQGCLEVLWRIAEAVKAMTNLDDVALQPVAGAQGELCGLKMIQAWQSDNSKTLRDVVLIPSSAHGTNFASAAVAGFSEIVRIDAAANGRMDVESVAAAAAKYGDRIGAIMITNPNTSGVFETDFRKIADIVHSVGGLVYMDGANYNAIAGRVDLKALGVDAMHNNIHKTWAAPHGGGGAGDGFVAVDAKLSDYIPAYRVVKDGVVFKLERPKKSMGSLHRNFGNFSNKIRALGYITRLGNDGVRRMSATAVLSSRYLLKKLSAKWDTLPEGAIDTVRMHEFILKLPEAAFIAFESVGVSRRLATARAGKMFLDFGYHAPTVAFPEEFGLMIEPTESYDKSELDRFVEAASAIVDLIEKNPTVAAAAPHFTPVSRIDEVEANRRPILSEKLVSLPPIPSRGMSPSKLVSMSIADILEKLNG